MEDFALRWCQHHFSYPYLVSGVPADHLHQYNSVLLPEQLHTESAFHPSHHPGPGQPIQNATSSQGAKRQPSESTSSDEVSTPEDAGWDPGPVQEAPPDQESRARYLRLLLATETHRRERQRRRRAEQAPPPLQLGADTEQLRRRQMSRLYGAAAERVAAAESRAQLEFDTVTDRHRPPLWPNIPLKIRFQ